MTPPEVALWQALRGSAPEGFRFRRQHPIGPWIVDFYCAKHRLAVEVDGWGHNLGELGHDERRDADIGRRGVRVIRFNAADVLRDIDGVVNTIITEAQSARLPLG